MSVQVLFLSSNAGVRPEWAGRRTGRDMPSDKIIEVQSNNWLEVDREFTSLQAALGFPGLQDNNVLQTLPDVRWMQINQVLAHVKERVVLHFSGHGDLSGALYMRKEDGEPVAVEPKHLVEVVAQFRDRIPLIVLNACYSMRLAQAFTGAAIDVVIGMTHAVEDVAAIAFSQTFYRNLIFTGQTIGGAFASAKAAIAAEFRGSGNEPAILARPGVDPNMIVLFEPQREDTRISPHHSRQILNDHKQRLREEMDSLLLDLGKLGGQKVTYEMFRECEWKLSNFRKGLDGRKAGLYLAQIGLPSGRRLVMDVQAIGDVIDDHIQELDRWNEELKRIRARMLDQAHMVIGTIGVQRM